MSETKEVAKRLYEACLSGSVETLNELIGTDQLVLNRVSSTECFSSDTPLHVAVSCGHLEFTKALLRRKPKLAAELDSRRCSPLHLASTEGHFEIVHKLLGVNTDICVTRDQDGRIPLHLAIMKGRVEVIQELLRVTPHSVHVKLCRGETVLHLSIQYNRLEALKTLVEYLQSNDMESDLLNSTDFGGNTILHLAATLKQVDTVEYLLGIKRVKDHANDKNQNGSTALDVVEHCPNRDLKTMEIREFLLQAGVHRSNCDGPQPNPELPQLPPNNPPCTQHRDKLRKMISGFKLGSVWLEEARGHIITASALTAAVAYQSILSPPGGLWQENKKGDSLAPSPSSGDTSNEIAGHAIMASHGSYPTYLLLNTMVLAASLSTIMLAISGFPMDNKLLTLSMVLTVYLTIICMGGAYVTAIRLVSPEQLSKDLLDVLLWSWLGLCILFLTVVLFCHFLVKLVRKCYGRRKSTQELPTIQYNEDKPAGSHKCVGNFC